MVKITDLRCAVIGGNPVVRITTDAGIDGYGQVDSLRPSLKQNVLFYKDLIVGQDPTDVERVIHRIRRYGAFKPWGTAVSVIEVALWDIAGKAADLPVHKLLGGKVRDRIRVYNGQVRFPRKGWDPKHWAEDMQKMKESPEGFTIIKQGISFHSQTPENVPDYFYGQIQEGPRQGQTGALTEKGMKYTIACVEAMKEVLGDEIGLALDCGPGWTVPDAIRFAKAIEPYNVMWCEDMITGDYTPYVLADVYKQVTQATSTPIHTGEEIYLRQNFRELIEQKAVRILGPDPLDMGGIAELKWVAEYAALHGLLIAPHGVGAGLIGLAAHVQVGAAMPDNFIAFEYPTGNPKWWYDIVDGLPDPIVKKGFVDVWDKPGLGVTINPRKARKYLDSGDKDFFG